MQDITLYCKFAHLDAGVTRLPDESTILRYRHLLKQNNLGEHFLAAWNTMLSDHRLMRKSCAVVDATLITAPSTTKNDKGERCLDQEKYANMDLQITMMLGKHKALCKNKVRQALTNRHEQIKASIRAKVKHPFRLIKFQFGHSKTRLRGRAKNTSQLLGMFALTNLFMLQRRMIEGLPAGVCPKQTSVRATKQTQICEKSSKLANKSLPISPYEYPCINS